MPPCTLTDVNAFHEGTRPGNAKSDFRQGNYLFVSVCWVSAAMKNFFFYFYSSCLVWVCGCISAHAFPAAGWPMYNKDFLGQRFSSLHQINVGNVAQLREVCRIKLARGGSFHTGPIVVDGVMYVTTARLTIAINPRNCNLLWRSVYVPEEREVWATNRGAALVNGRLIRGTADGRLLSLDAKTGKLLWQTAAGDPKKGEFFSSAPIAWHGLVFTGIAGGDWGIRGRMMAFDLTTGREVWRFNTVPMPHEPGAETWERPETLDHGGGGTWGSYALDIEKEEVFVPVANPAPDFSPALRPGANLYTNSVVVLDARSGKLKWWYQVAPNDGHDYGIGAAPMLYQQADGKQVVAIAPKDGHVYVIDRSTHGLLFKTPVTTIENAGLPPTPEGRRFCPGVYGGSEWNGPAFDAPRRAIVVGSVDWCSIIRSEAPDSHREKGSLFMGGSYKQLSPAMGWVSSLDADNGRIRWQYKAEAPIVAGVTPTAGGVVFTGDMAGNFLALDADSGKLLYKFNTGGAIAGGVITYALEGRQYVASTSGNVSRATLGALGAPAIIVMALQGAENASPKMIDAAGTDGEVPDLSSKGSWRARFTAMWTTWMQGLRSVMSGATATVTGTQKAEALALRGKNLFAANCAGCHGADGSGLAGPSLRNLSTRLSDAKIADVIKHPKPPMPTLYPSLLSGQDVHDIAAYVHTLK